MSPAHAWTLGWMSAAGVAYAQAPLPAAPPPSAASLAPTAPLRDHQRAGRPAREAHLSPWPTHRRGRIDFDKADIRDVAKFISEITGKNIILSDKARGGKLTIFSPSAITRGEAYQAFLAALEVNDLTAVQSGRFLKVVPVRDAKELPIPTSIGAPKRGEHMVTAILRVRHADAKEIHNVVQQLRNKSGFSLTYAPTNSLIIADLAANVRRLAKIVAQLDVPTGTRDRIWVLRAEHASAADLAEKLTQVFGDKGAPAATPGGTRDDDAIPKVTKVVADERTNQLIIVANEAAYLKVVGLVAQIGRRVPHEQGTVHVYYLQNAEAQTLAGVLSGLAGGNGAAGARPNAVPRPAGSSPGGGTTATASLFSGEVKISADKATNALVIVAAAKDFERVKTIIAKLDIRRRQVFVEAVIMEVSTNQDRELGVALNGGTSVDSSGKQVPIFGGTTFGKLSSLSLDATALTGLAMVIRGPSIGGTSGILGSGISIPSFGVVLRAMQSQNDVNVLSTPHLLASDNEEAEILVGQNVPFVAGSSGANLSALSSLGTAAAASLSSLSALGSQPLIQRQDVALTLKVTPQINEGDFVRLKVEQEVNDLAGDDPVRGPTTTKRRIKTTVSIKDRQTVVLGGLMRNNESDDVTKVPLLGDIPLLGYLFRSTVKKKEKRNLLVFLTPYIIKDQEDLQRIYRQKMDERQEFLERFASDTPGYKAHIDYERRYGLLEAIHQTTAAVEREETRELAEKAENARRKEEEANKEDVVGKEVTPARMPPAPQPNKP